MRVAVIGLGSMGRAFASRALATGYDVTVWNRSPQAAAELVAGGATQAGSAADAAAAAEVSLVVVSDDDAVEAVCLGNDGVLEGLTKDGVLANLSTVSPSTARRLADKGPGDRVLDAPVMGAPALVAKGGGRFLIGGDRSTVTRLDPLWADLGDSYAYCGNAGTGATMKLLSNLQLVVGVIALAEGITIARGHGIPDSLLREVFGSSPVVSSATQGRLESLLSADHPGWFGPALARKDVRLALRLAEQSKVPVALGPAADGLLSRIVASDRDWPDFAAVIEALH
jgi:3-hydroxyisobutyrate dehydrogenase